MIKEEWENAKLYLIEKEKNYLTLSNMPGVNVKFVCRMVIEPLLDRYDNGERTQELYDAMLAVE